MWDGVPENLLVCVLSSSKEKPHIGTDYSVEEVNFCMQPYI